MNVTTDVIIPQQRTGSTEETLSGDLTENSLAYYGLSGPEAWEEPEPELLRLASLGATLFPGLGTAIVLFDDLVAHRVINTGGEVRVDDVSTASTICHRLSEVAEGEGPWSVPDAAADPRFFDHPAVDGRVSALRSYAAAPLRDRSGALFGTVCVFSDDPSLVEEEHLVHLTGLAAATMAALELHRKRLPLATSSAHATRSVHELDPQDWTIADVLSRQAVTTLFQPVVHLATREVVGFEALARGPEGSPVESPLDLIAAAKEADCLAELDWLCRVKSLAAATAADLPGSLSWLVNVEPAGLAIECPEPLRADLAAAQAHLRVILEVVERDVEGYATDLLHATDRARQDSWGVALDDVGTEAGSLALLPFLRPDVVKLDMSLLRAAPPALAAEITAAVAAHVERTGAVILAEGIETESELELAQVFGASYGQGWLFGRPGPLPETVPVPRHVIPLRQRLAPLDSRTPHEVLTDLQEPRRAAKRHLTHISSHIEAQCTGEEAAVLLVSFDDVTHFSGATEERIRRVVDSSALTMVLADGLPSCTQPRLHTGPTRPLSRLSEEWVVAAITPHYAAAFVARSAGDEGPQTDERYDYFYTQDRDAVIAVMRSFLAHVKPAPAALSAEPPASDPVGEPAPEPPQRSRFRFLR